MSKKNFSWLFFALLVFLAAVPVADDLNIVHTGIVRAVMTSWLLVIGVWSLRGFGRRFVAGIVLVVAGIALNLIAARTGSPLAQSGALAALLGFLLVATWCLSSQIIGDPEISLNRLIGAVSLYLMLGVAWAIAYLFVEMHHPGSFSGLTLQPDEGWSSAWLYFSFVTMTTLGYGDIVPVSATARTLAYLQAIFGLFYIAILVASLVGTYISERQSTSRR